MSGKLNVTLVRSPIGCPQDQKDTARALGLTRMHKTMVHNDTPPVRGMLRKIRHLVRVESNATEGSE